MTTAEEFSVRMTTLTRQIDCNLKRREDYFTDGNLRWTQSIPAAQYQD